MTEEAAPLSKLLLSKINQHCRIDQILELNRMNTFLNVNYFVKTRIPNVYIIALMCEYFDSINNESK